MNLPLRCSCGARFTTSDDLRGQLLRCPKCRRTLRVPAAVAAGTDATVCEFVSDETAGASQAAEANSTWQSRSRATVVIPDQSRTRWKWLLLAVVFIAPLGLVGTLIALPYLRPKDPRELVAQQYLEALCREDHAVANKLSVLATHPRLVGVERVGMTERAPTILRGKFQGLRQFHSEINREYTWNPDRGRFQPKDALGLGLNVLSELEEVKKKAQEQADARAAGSARKKMSQEERNLESALGAYGAIGEMANKLAGGVLSSGTLGPTYDDLLEKTNVPLSDAERALAEHYARDPTKWQRLLDRSFLDLPDLGDFELQEVEIVATIRTEGQSLGEPGRPVKLRLVRFTIGLIDTGWRVWQAE